MVIKRSIPTWSVLVTIVVVLSIVGAFYMLSNPGALDRDAILRARTRPGGSPAAAPAAAYGQPRGTPIVHQAPIVAGAGARQKPGGR